MPVSDPIASAGRGPPPRLILFLKAPRPGDVMTRLARTLGHERAVAIYRELAERQLAALPPEWPVEVRFAPPEARAEMAAWLGADGAFRPQTAGDLGTRMEDAVTTAFAEGAPAVICLGADCPELGAEDLAAARAALAAGADLVFGPATDGGYYLLGLARPCPEVFRGIPWSTPDTLARSLVAARAAARRVALLEEKFDIDEAADWVRFLRMRAPAAIHAPS